MEQDLLLQVGPVLGLLARQSVSPKFACKPIGVGETINSLTEYISQTNPITDWLLSPIFTPSVVRVNLEAASTMQA
jgi:hypothetical protein